MKLQFNVDRWAAWAPARTSRDAWQAWALGQPVAGPCMPPDLAFIPAMQRRRLSSLSRMAVATAADCSGQLAVPPICIFASRHGELTRTMKIMESIVRHDDISPADFSQSVFNTALGLFSIFTANKGPSTMVVAGEDTFGSALIEASLHMARYPDVPVLLVCFDEPLPEPLACMETPAGETFCLALLLSAGAAPNLQVGREFNASGCGDARNCGLDFLRFWLSGTATATVATTRSCWRWHRL